MLTVPTRGFCAIGVYQNKTESNFGTLIRTARSFDFNFVFTIGKRWKEHHSSIKAERHFPILHFDDFLQWKKAMPRNTELIIVELNKKATCLMKFKHPQRAIYLLGAEDYGLPMEFLQNNRIIQIPGLYCHNVAIAGSIIMYDRIFKNNIEELVVHHKIIKGK